MMNLFQDRFSRVCVCICVSGEGEKEWGRGRGRRWRETEREEVFSAAFHGESQCGADFPNGITYSSCTFSICPMVSSFGRPIPAVGSSSGHIRKRGSTSGHHPVTSGKEVQHRVTREEWRGE